MIMNPILCVILILYASVSRAEIYKTIDEHGAVHYSSQPSDSGSQIVVPVELPSIKKNNSQTQANGQTLNEYLDELMEIAQEMAKEADSCYYNAFNRKTFDISCKNYFTLLKRDFKPAVSQIVTYIREHDLSETKSAKIKLDEMKDLADESDSKVRRAIDYLHDLYSN